MTFQRLAVATECPSCGAPLDFGEGSNAIRCDHCRTNLLVTGRKRVLSYWIPPRVEAAAVRRAAHDAETDGRPRLGEASLWFLPYYRVTGHEIRTERSAPKPSEASPWTADPTLGEAVLRAISLRGGELPPTEPAFRDRSIEKNFLAAELGPLAPYSIGVRATVLRLELFRREPIEALGTIVAPALDRDAALELGTRSLSQGELLRRELLAVRLAIIFFPFWTVEVERRVERRTHRRLSLVDGVTGAVVQRDVDPSLLEKLGRPLPGDAQTVGFRPLLCPNCGWDLPLRPDDCVFCCRGCRRAWEIDGAELVDTPTEIAAVTAPTAKPGRRADRRPLPFWRLGGAGRLVPAFRFRRLKSIVDLASSYTKRPPAIEIAADEPPELTGAYFDRDDAGAIARFVEEGDGATGTGERLVWIPYQGDGYSLVDPFFGIGLAQNLLL